MFVARLLLYLFHLFFNERRAPANAIKLAISDFTPNLFLTTESGCLFVPQPRQFDAEATLRPLLFDHVALNHSDQTEIHIDL